MSGGRTELSTESCSQNPDVGSEVADTDGRLSYLVPVADYIKCGFYDVLPPIEGIQTFFQLRRKAPIGTARPTVNASIFIGCVQESLIAQAHQSFSRKIQQGMPGSR